MKFDTIIEVRFKTPAEGGRQTAIAGSSYYACPLFVDGEAFECRVQLDGKAPSLGETYQLHVTFMNPDLVLTRLTPGVRVALWEGKEIATGKIIRIIASGLE